MVKKLFLGVILLILLFVSLFPRSIEVLNGNPVFLLDQGRDMMAVKSIVVDHKQTLIGAELGAGQAGLQYLFHGPGYFYMMTIPFILSDGNPVAGVWLMLFFGLGAIALSIFLTNKLLGWKEGLLMGFLIALCPFFIGQSRLYENHFPTTFIILGLFYLVYKFTKNQKSHATLFFAAFISSFIYNFEFADAVPLSITLLLYCALLLKQKLLPKLPIMVLGFTLGILPMILFEARHGFMGIKSLFTYIFIYHPPHESSPNIIVHAEHIFDLLVYSFSDSFPGRLVLPIIPILIGFITMVAFVYTRETDKLRKQFILYLLLLFPVNIGVFLLLRNIVFQHYIIDLFLAELLLTTYGVFGLMKLGYRKVAILVFAYLVFLIATGTKNAYEVSMQDYNDYGGIRKLKGEIDAIDFIYQDAKGKPFGLLVFAPPIYTYQYDYLIWWHGKRKYGYVPYQEKKGTFYLLIEPDPSKPWSYKGWEETVVKTGKVEFSKTLPSGFIIEKRTEE